jgi:hypothetical protein
VIRAAIRAKYHCFQMAVRSYRLSLSSVFLYFDYFSFCKSIKNLSLMDLHNLCFSIWYQNMLQNGKNQIHLNFTGLFIYVLLWTLCNVFDIIIFA